MATNRIKEARLRRELTREELAARLGVTGTTIYRWETGRRAVTGDDFEAVAAALDCTPAELVGARQVVPVVGQVGAGAQIIPIDDHALGAELEEVPAPPGVRLPGCVAVRVTGHSMEPLIRPGWLLFYDREPRGVASECLHSICVVRIVEGPTLVKLVKPGYTPGHYNLVSFNMDIMENMPLEWAVKVHTMRQG